MSKVKVQVVDFPQEPEYHENLATKLAPSRLVEHIRGLTNGEVSAMQDGIRWATFANCIAWGIFCLLHF